MNFMMQRKLPSLVMVPMLDRIPSRLDELSPQDGNGGNVQRRRLSRCLVESLQRGRDLPAGIKCCKAAAKQAKATSPITTSRPSATLQFRRYKFGCYLRPALADPLSCFEVGTTRLVGLGFASSSSRKLAV